MAKPICLLAFLLIPGCTLAQSRFSGKWYNDNELNWLDIKQANTGFQVACNQLFLSCRNTYKKDTLLLFALQPDCGRFFYDKQNKLPKRNSLFAKCYIRKDKLQVIYTQKFYRKNIAELELDTVFIKAPTK